MMDQADAGAPPESSSLIQGARVLRERWWIPVATVVLCVFAALGLALTATKQYDSTASILVRPSTLPKLIAPAANDSGRDAVRDQGTNLLLVTSSPVTERVRKRLAVPADEDIAASVVAESEQDADIVTVTATDPDPERAAAIANAYAEEFVGYRRDSERARIAEGEQLLRRQIAALPEAAINQRAELERTRETLVALAAVTTGDAETVGRATASSTPSSPKPKRDAVLAVLLGAVLGIAIAFLIDLFDRRVKSIEDFEALYRFRALTSIPLRSRDPSTQRDRQAALEPFRILRNGLGLLGGPREVRVVLVTSAVPGEGKSTVAAGLARAIALSGQSVALVEVDLRRPTFHQQFDLGADPRGLTSALVGGLPVRGLLRPVLPGLRTLLVLPSGPLPPNSAELLRSPEMGSLLSELAAEVDVVVLDAPPLLPVADSQVLLDHPQVDACLVVARAYQTTRDEVRRTRAVLDRHRLQNLGLVVNGLRTLDSGYDYYGSADGDEQGAQRLTRA